MRGLYILVLLVLLFLSSFIKLFIFKGGSAVHKCSPNDIYSPEKKNRFYLYRDSKIIAENPLRFYSEGIFQVIVGKKEIIPEWNTALRSYFVDFHVGIHSIPCELIVFRKKVLVESSNKEIKVSFGDRQMRFYVIMLISSAVLSILVASRIFP